MLSKAGISNVPTSAVTGNVGTSPITGAAISLPCTEVAGQIYTVDAVADCMENDPSKLTSAVGAMETLFSDLTGRKDPDFLNLGAGNIGGRTLAPGLYKYSTPLLITSDVTIEGSSTDIWIFQVAQKLQLDNGVRITLEGGALAENVYWAVTEQAVLGTTSHFEGTLLSATAINMKTHATINGRLYAQTAITLEMNTVTLA
mmetsp:Transcript_13036/g.11106  ORF Transcript_13036/g.11106 Transcript_13036/m.11106 type:complete len:201 (-) Transcript_13036:171-773(-)